MDAATAVGTGQPNDYVLAPAQHAVELAASAPELAHLLTGSRFHELAGQYEDADASAVAAQKGFRVWVNRANWSVLATATFSSLLMAVGLMKTVLDAATQPLLVVLALLGVAGGGLASMALYRVKEGHLLEEWMVARARAETLRLEYFTAVTGAVDDPLDVRLEQQKLEYFRRFQLDVQIAYYGNRGSQHRAAASRTLDIAAWSVLLAGVASGAAGVLGALATEWAALGVLAVVGTALQSFAAAREGTSQDRRNGERYERTLQALQSLRGRLDDVRQGVAAGSHAVLVEYVAAVQDQISLEHRQWLAGTETARAAVGRLEQELQRSAQRPQGGEGAHVPPPEPDTGAQPGDGP
jgi:hypothetical protein